MEGEGNSERKDPQPLGRVQQEIKTGEGEARRARPSDSCSCKDIGSSVTRIRELLSGRVTDGSGIILGI